MNLIFRKIDPNWILADKVTLLEHQVLNLIDTIDINAPWDDVENKSRYLDLYKTIIRLIFLINFLTIFYINN